MSDKVVEPPLGPAAWANGHASSPSARSPRSSTDRDALPATWQPPVRTDVGKKINEPRGFAAGDFRLVLGHFASGVAVATAIDDEPVGLTIQSFCSLSLDPPLILLCPSRSSASWPRVDASGSLCINLLAAGQSHVARQFALSGTDKFAGIAWRAAAATGSPILEGVLAWIDCRIEETRVVGDHFVVVCRVLDLDALPDLAPLIFFRGNYQRA